MPTEIMDEYLGKLEEKERELVEFVVQPFLYTAQVLAEEAMSDEGLIKEEVDLGPIVLIASGRTPSEVEESKRTIHEKGDSLITHIANEEFEAEFLASKPICTLPDIAALRKTCRTYPIFALLVAAHDVNCDACVEQGDEGYEERKEDAANFVATINVEDQQFLVSHASHFLEATLRGMLASEKQDLFENNPALSISERCGETCIFADGLTQEYVRWILNYPYFLENPICHAVGCSATRQKLSAFEREQVESLPAQEQSLYRDQAFIATRGDGHLLFE